MHDLKLTRISGRSLTRIAGAAIVGVALITAAGCGSDKSTAAAPAAAASGADTASASYHGATVVVAGHGEASGTPDTMTMTIGVQTTQPSAKEALDRNDVEATALVSTLKAKGVATKDIQTSNLSISPNYNTDSHITGYTASNMVTIKIHGLGPSGARAGDIIDAGAAAAGPDITFNGVQLSIDDTSGLLREARAAAVKQAIGHGQQLAEAAGMKLGTVRLIDDTASQVPGPQYLAADATARKSAAPIEAGSQLLSVDVSVTFAITN